MQANSFSYHLVHKKKIPSWNCWLSCKIRYGSNIGIIPAVLIALRPSRTLLYFTLLNFIGIKLLILSTLVVVACASGTNNYSERISNKNCNEVVEERVEVSAGSVGVLCEYLNSPLWIDRDVYDATHVLIVPLEYAFLKNDKKLKHCFSNYIERLNKVIESDQEISLKKRLSWLQHLHFVARYWVLLSYNQGVYYVINHPGFTNLIKEFNRFWEKEPAWLWGREPFRGIRERVEWKLNSSDTMLKHSYYNVIVDEDYYALTLGLDLYGLFRRADQLDECVGSIRAKDLFFRVFTERVTWSDDDKWLVDVGKWREHPDMSYAMYYKTPLSKEGENLPPSPRETVVIDSSHAHRYPSWLRSAELALTSEDKVYVKRLQNGLRKQFLDVILSPNYGRVPVLNNYMDGHNGFFRWGYSTLQGAHKGYAPYGMTGTFALGWWSLLGGDDIARLYMQLSNAYPLSPAELNLYEDPSTRECHPLVTEKYKNGLSLTLSQMAFEVSAILKE